MEVGVDVVARVGLVAMTVRAGWRGIEVDAGRLDGGFLLGPLVGLILLRVVARQVAPSPHRASCGIIV